MTKVDPYLHAALVLHGAGKPIDKNGLVAVLKAAGAEADEAKAKVLSEALSGVNMEDMLKNATTVVAAAPASAPASGAAKKEEKKEEESEEKKEEAAAEGLANLFG
ncbi:MAG: 50S ribosomal protein P1 [Candidatus ainarchaeum sp.]|nr:50S ribosomal protein P1 [Candidatus ainarchaeum sp.]